MDIQIKLPNGTEREQAFFDVLAEQERGRIFADMGELLHRATNPTEYIWERGKKPTQAQLWEEFVEYYNTLLGVDFVELKILWYLRRLSKNRSKILQILHTEYNAFCDSERFLKGYEPINPFSVCFVPLRERRGGVGGCVHHTPQNSSVKALKISDKEKKR